MNECSWAIGVKSYSTHGNSALAVVEAEEKAIVAVLWSFLGLSYL